MPQNLYDESFVKTPPNEGGRGHIIFTSAASKSTYKLPLTVSFNNGKLKAIVSPSFNLMPTGLDWIHCDILNNTKSVFISFHTRSNSVLSNIGDTVTVTDAAGVTLGTASFKFPPVGSDFKSNYPVWVTYVATANNYKTLYIHLHNYDASKSYTINKLLLNGNKIDANISIPSNQHLLKKYDVSILSEGAIWTIGMEMNDGVNVGFGGRLMKEWYSFESYSKSGQCPFPGANNKNYETFKSDLYLQTGFCQTGDSICNQDFNSILNASQADKYRIPVGEHYTKDGPTGYVQIRVSFVYFTAHKNVFLIRI